MNKKLLLFLLIAFIKLQTSRAQWVTIPDSNFVYFLQMKYPSCMNGNQMDTICSLILTEDSIEILNFNVSSIEGIQYFKNLVYLACYYQPLSSLPQLPNHITFLEIDHSLLTGLPQLPDSLEVLWCNYNLLTSLPSLPINLVDLDCYNNQLTSLPTLPNSIEHLRCSNNQLTSLPLLPDSIRTLNASNNYLTSLASLPSNLSFLGISYNQLTIIPPLPGSVKHLFCGNNPLSALPVLPTGLISLECENLQLTSLPTMPYINNLLCRNNLLTNLPPMPYYSQVYCSNNLLTNLPPMPYIGYLDCSNNLLTNLPAMPNNMYKFFINNNNINCLNNLPLVGNINDAAIWGNPLTCVPNQTNYSLGLPLCLDNDPVNNPINCAAVVNITGSVYDDLNNNCLFNLTDLNTENLPVKLYDGSSNLLALSYTVNGVYSFTGLQPDTFIVKIEDNILPVFIDCAQPNTQPVHLDSINQTISGIHFPVECDTSYDIRVQSTYHQGWVFPGQQHNLFSHISNNVPWYNLNCSSNVYSGPVIMTIAGPFSYVATLPGALVPTVNGNVFTYNVTDFNTLNPNSFGLQLQVDSSAQFGNQICVHVEIYPSPLDADTTNNVYDFCYNVVNSYDPNLKEVYPANVLPGYDDWFTYTIHFQNTGTAPAFNIRLRDTLDANLDINTFEFLGASHQANTSVNGHNLMVRFNNIMLPDSTTDYEGSMGYYQYRIKPLSGLPVGTDIENTAYIYFDYNPAIATNSTHNIFDMATADRTLESRNAYVLYPNPSSGVFTFKENRNIRNVEVYNLFGEEILHLNNTKQIDLSAYPKGIYIAKINGQYVSKLVKE